MKEVTKMDGIESSVIITEDKKFLTGKGKYTDDINRPGQVQAYFLRSDVAHATIKKIDRMNIEIVLIVKFKILIVIFFILIR